MEHIKALHILPVVQEKTARQSLRLSRIFDVATGKRCSVLNCVLWEDLIEIDPFLTLQNLESQKASCVWAP
jgi:hypothetical protein